MFKRLLQKAAKPIPATTEGERIYAIGDVHGCADLLSDLLEEIKADLRLAPATGGARLIFLGDYVDRGPDSRGVVDQLLALKAAPPAGAKVQFLKGNHEEALLNFLLDPEFGPPWVQHGGLMTLASYGVDPPLFKGDEAPGGWDACRRELSEKLPAEHLEFFQALELLIEVGSYVFVHAGVRPGIPLAKQTPTDVLWIREAFLGAANPCPKTVVHGHTPIEQPHQSLSRIGVDTGAYATGVLTAARVEDGQVSFLQVKRNLRAA